jgi:Tfp pilus assembly protein PilO
MSQEQPMQSRALGRQPIRVRFDQLKRSPGLRVIGLPELLGLCAAALLALIAIFAYFYFLAPANARLTSARLERDRLQGQLRAMQVNLNEDTTARETVDRINASLKDFESNRLAEPRAGRMSLYIELNELIRSNGLRNTSGPSYTTLEPLGTKGQVQTAGAQQQSNAKWQSIYPGISVSVTVEGPYQSVRHFVRDIETSRQFLIVNAVELESVTQTGVTAQETPIVRTPTPNRNVRTPVPPPSVAQPSGARGTLVSLRLDLATYFQRAGS